MNWDIQIKLVIVINSIKQYFIHQTVESIVPRIFLIFSVIMLFKQDASTA